MTDRPSETVLERFQPTNGRLSGFLGLGCAAVIFVLAVAAWDAGQALGVAISACLGAVLVWAALLRPALWVTEHDLVMRSMFHTDRIPLGSIGKVVVGQVLAVTSHGKRYVSPVVGYTARQTIKAKAAAGRPDAKAPSAQDTYQVFVEERISHFAKEHREQYGEAAGPVRRTYAWPEIAAALLGVAALAVWALV